MFFSVSSANIIALTNGEAEIGLMLRDNDYRLYQCGIKKQYEDMSPEFVILHNDEEINVICSEKRTKAVYEDDTIRSYDIN